VSNNKWAVKNKVELDAKLTMVETKKGKIEYIKWGEAPYMLLLPGTPGWAFFHFGFYREDSGFGVITVNRPGYGNVPLTNDNKTAEQQADLCVALMEHLGIDKFPLMVASGGGCIGLRMAI
jgi:pimeloyl-ACP methyl ester carboxylesterase